MAEYAHLPEPARYQGDVESDGPDVLVVDLADGKPRTYPGDYRTDIVGGVLVIYPPSKWTDAVAPIAAFRSGWSFSYSGHELGDRTPVIDDPHGLLGLAGEVLEHLPYSPAEVGAAYDRESGAQ